MGLRPELCWLNSIFCLIACRPFTLPDEFPYLFYKSTNTFYTYIFCNSYAMSDICVKEYAEFHQIMKPFHRVPIIGKAMGILVALMLLN